jgi:hypothetical protein
MHKKLVPAIIFILITIIVSILLLNYYQVNIETTNYDNLKLNRAVIFETFKNNYF